MTEEIIQAFADRGIRHFFGIPGSGFLMDLMDAGRRLGVDLVTTAHESSAAISAAYYGRHAGAPGLAIAIQGPGAANLASGAAMAWFERMPVVCLCERAPLDADPRIAQICDARTMFASVTKEQFVITPDRPVHETIEDAISCAASARPGPVLVEVPKDCMSWLTESSSGLRRSQTSQADQSSSPRYKADDQTSVTADDKHSSMTAATDFIDSLERPVIVIGGDVLRSGAHAACAEFARKVGGAVLVATDARGAFPESDPQCAGVFANLQPEAILANRVFAWSDGAVFVGIDPKAAEAIWTLDVPVCSIDAHHDSLVDEPVVRVVGELKQILVSLTETVMVDTLSARARAEEAVMRVRNEVAPRFMAPDDSDFSIQDIISISRDVLPKEGILFSETGVFVLMLEYLWSCDTPDTFFGSAGGRSMGLMIPALLGASIAQPNRPMMGIGGDGSSLMRLGELEAFARSGASAPIVIVNDNAYGTIKSRQAARGIAEYSLDLGPVDFARVAEGCGLPGVVVDSSESFREALTNALESETATIIEARVDGDEYRASFGPTTGA